MKVWTCTAFKGHFPIGSAAVVYANTPEEAADLLNAVLREKGLDGDARAEKMDEFPRDVRFQEVSVLCDGNY